jgi:hypothetical protein
MEHESQWFEKAHECLSPAGAVGKAGLLMLTVILFLPVMGWAQDQATIVGIVTDSSGAVLPGAKIVVSNPDKGFVRDLVTNSAGEYTAAKIPSGNYIVTVEATGFQKLVRTGIRLDVDQTLRLDMQLTLGQVTQQITVSGNVTKVETESGTVSDVVTGNQIISLDLSGRQFQQLSLLTPGTSVDNDADFSHLGHGYRAYMSFNGLREDSTNWNLDGQSAEDNSSGGVTLAVFPNVESIAEFRVSTSNYGADLGSRGAAQINVVTKSGTKDFHGTAFEFVKNNALNANDFFLNRQPWSSLDVQADCGGNPAGPCNAPKAPLQANTFGYTLGGPVYIPGHYNTDKSKTFFFYSQYWAKYRDGKEIGPTNVPSLRMRQGDFSECDPHSTNYNAVAASGCTLPINPATGQTFAGDVVPIDPNAKAMLNAFVPLPNNGVDGYVSSIKVPADLLETSARVDQNIGDTTRFFAKFSYTSWTKTVAPALYSSNTYDTVETHRSVPAPMAWLQLVHTFKPNLMNEFIYGFSGEDQIYTPLVGPTSPSGSLTKPSDWTGGNFFPANATMPYLPGIAVSGGTPFSFIMAVHLTNYRQWFPVNTYRDNVAWTVGRHTLKFGLQAIIYHTSGPGSCCDPEGNYTFTGGGPLTTQNGLADMYLGRIRSYTENTAVQGGVAVGGWGWTRERKQQYEPYIQDDWKVNRRLTLNLGVRYYASTPEHDFSVPSNDANLFPALYNPANQAQLDINGNLIPGTGYNYTMFGNGLEQCGSPGIPVGCRSVPHNMFGPRFGFGFDPTGSGKTSIRGGYGIYYDNMSTYANAEQGVGNPPTSYQPIGYNINGYQNVVSGPLAPVSLTGYPSSGPWQSAQQYNVTVQHEFAGGNLLSVGWVGTLGRHLSRTSSLNRIPDGVGTMNVPALAGTTDCDTSGNCNVQAILMNQIQPNTFFVPYRGYSSIPYYEYGASSRYNSLQVDWRHRVGHGLSIEAAYTYAHGIDNESGNGNVGVDESDLNRWFATSDFNRTHALVLNYIYDLPFFKSPSNAAVKTALGGWTLSGITTFYSGEPVDFGCGVEGMSSGIGEGMRCNSLGPVKIDKSTYDDPQFGPTQMWYDPNSVGQPNLSQFSANGEPGMFGYMGRNTLTGPGRNNWDLALLKNFQLPWAHGEHSTLQFRFETFNTFNHIQWQYINAGCGSTTPFGSPCSGIANNYGMGEVSGAWSPRILQLAMKFMF